MEARPPKEGGQEKVAVEACCRGVRRPRKDGPTEKNSTELDKSRFIECELLTFRRNRQNVLTRPEIRGDRGTLRPSPVPPNLVERGTAGKSQVDALP